MYMANVLGNFKTREEILVEIKSDFETYCIFLEMKPEFREQFLEFCMGVRGVKMAYDPFFMHIFDAEVHPERLSDLLSQIIGESVKVKAVLPKEHRRISEKGSLLHYLNLGLLPDANAPAPGETFLHSLLNNLGLLLLIALLGLTIFGFPVAFAALAYKGMALGLSSVLILESMSLLKGSAAVFASLIPQNLLCIPAFVLAAAAAASLDMDILRHRKVGIKKALAQRAGDFLLLILFLGIVIAAGCCIESFISPFLLQLSK